jgi:hypothetical protein
MVMFQVTLKEKCYINKNLMKIYTSYGKHMIYINI